MDSSDQSLIVSIFALAAALITAVFVYMQAHGIKKQLHLDNYHKILELNRNLIQLAIGDPDLMNVLSSIEIANKNKQGKYLQLWVNHTDYVFFSYKNGLIDQQSWSAMKLDIYELFVMPSMKSHWNDVRDYYDPEFALFIDQLLLSRPAHGGLGDIIRLMPPWNSR